MSECFFRLNHYSNLSDLEAILVSGKPKYMLRQCYSDEIMHQPWHLECDWHSIADMVGGRLSWLVLNCSGQCKNVSNSSISSFAGKY